MGACEHNQSLASCDCILHRLEASRPVSDLPAAEAVLAGSAGEVPGWAAKALEVCG